MTTTLSFLKVISVSYNSGTDTTSAISRTYTDIVPSANNINVSFNGQVISQYTGSGTNPPTPADFAKYYWTVSGINTSSMTIYIYANSAYINSHYSGGSPLAYLFTASDIIFIEYTYILTM
jgi:hypothetical protein